MQQIITFLITLFAGLVSTAEYVHAGQADAGATKKAWVLAQLEAVLSGPLPAISGVNPVMLSVVLMVVRYLVPTFGGPAVDWLVAKLNANSFFVSIETYLAAGLNMLTGGSTTTPAAAPAN